MAGQECEPRESGKGSCGGGGRGEPRINEGGGREQVRSDCYSQYKLRGTTES
jgi:hypothetical protein